MPTQWIEALKVGDRVALIGCFSTKDSPNYVGLDIVTARTKSGRIRCGDAEYSPDGRRRGKSFAAGLAPYCTEAQHRVSELRDLARRKTRRNELVGKFMHLGWEQVASIADETLEAMAKLLDDGLAAAKKGKP